MNLNPSELAQEIYSAKKQGSPIEPAPSSRAEFNLPQAYQVVDQLAKLRQAEGAATVGRKVGFTNTAAWPRLNLDTIVWGYVYNDTAHNFEANKGSFSLARMVAPRIEPEIVFKLRHAFPTDTADLAQVLEAVEWIALGFELVDCPYPGWQFRPADMVAASGFHAALLIGQPQLLHGKGQLFDQFSDFQLTLSKNGTVAAEGHGTNVYGSPLLSLLEVAKIINSRSESAPLDAGEVITSGTVTDAFPISPGEEWTARVAGLDLPALSISFTR